MTTAASTGIRGRDVIGIRHGITILPELPWRESAPMWRAAEDMGFDHAWTYDHLVWGGLPDASWFAAVPTLAAAAGVTSAIGLGTFVSSPNYRHPYTFARDVLTLDDVSGGRFLCGLGTGGDLDARILGEERTLKQRVDRFHEFVPLLDRLLREDRVDHEGAWYSDVTVLSICPARWSKLSCFSWPLSRMFSHCWLMRWSCCRKWLMASRARISSPSR